MRETRSSGSVGGPGRKARLYPEGYARLSAARTGLNGRLPLYCAA